MNNQRSIPLLFIMRMSRFFSAVGVFLLRRFLSKTPRMNLRKYSMIVIRIKVQGKIGLFMIIQACNRICFGSGMVQCRQKQSR